MTKMINMIEKDNKSGLIEYLFASVKSAAGAGAESAKKPEEDVVDAEVVDDDKK